MGFRNLSLLSRGGILITFYCILDSSFDFFHLAADYLGQRLAQAAEVRSEALASHEKAEDTPKTLEKQNDWCSTRHS